MENTNLEIVKHFDRLKEFVVAKNIDYGDSLQKPIGIFSKDPMVGILGRLDDKLGRIKSVGVNEETIDTVDDLIGYLVHLRIMYDRNLEEIKNE